MKKTSEATLSTIQDMLNMEDYDVSESFQHSRSTESVKSSVSDTYLSKPSLAKRRANQQETELFYFTVRVSAYVQFNACTSTLKNAYHMTIYVHWVCAGSRLSALQFGCLVAICLV